MSLLLFSAFEAAPAAPLPAFESAFAALVRQMDRIAMPALGEQPVTYTTELGVSHTTTPLGAPLRGIFDPVYVLAKGSADAGVEARAPSVFLRLEDLPEDPEDGDPTLTIGGIDYRVIERQPDGIGGIVLLVTAVV